jgi:hypothetical protein
MSELKQVHPSERLIIPETGPVDIDVEMVPLMRQLWAMGLTTLGCCQDFGDSILHNGHRSTTTDDDRQRFADFYRGQAWLKMPVANALRLISSISDHPLFSQRLRRWTHPEAWMSIAYIFPDFDGSAELAKSAQLHFPRVQIPELVEALTT